MAGERILVCRGFLRSASCKGVIFVYKNVPVGYGQAYRLSGEMFGEYDYPDDGHIVFAM